MFYLWVSHRYTCEHPWVTCTCAMPYHPQTTQWLIQYCTCPYGLTGQQKSTETWASAPSHLHPPTPITHCPSPPSPCQMMMWQPLNAPPQLLCPPHLTHPPSPCLQTPLHLHTYVPPQCAHPQTAPPLLTCLSHLPLSTPTPAMQHLTHPCPQTSMAPLLNAPLAPTLHQQTPRPSLYSWQPAQLCLQCSPRQLCMDCVISWLFVQTHKIPGAVWTTTVTVLTCLLIIPICTSNIQICAHYILLTQFHHFCIPLIHFKFIFAIKAPWTISTCRVTYKTEHESG